MIRRTRFRFVIAAAGVVAFSIVPGTALAYQSGTGPARIVEGQPTLGPLAFVRFCIANERECVKRDGAKRVALTPALVRQLADVNASVNADIAVDHKHVGNIPWSVASWSGDCNTFALLKRHRLMEKGWPAGALSLAVVRLRSGVTHLVLVVRTDGSDLVLDNLTRRVEDWTRSPYTWVAIQSMRDPERWVEISTWAASAPASINRPEKSVAVVQND